MGYNLKQSLFFQRDQDAINFTRAAGLTDPTQIEAIHYLVGELKNNNLWTKFNALYPFVGGTATTHKFNLKNPLDTDGAFRIVFSGGITHDSNGVTFNGITGYGNTFLRSNVTLTLNNESMCLYSKTSTQALLGAVDLGAANTITQRDELIIRSNLDTASGAMNSITDGAGRVSYTTTNGAGFLLASRISSTDLQLYKNGITQATASASNNGTRSNIPIYIGARNVTNLPNGFVNRNFAFAGLGEGFNSAQALILYNIVQQYQTRLNRQV